MAHKNYFYIVSMNETLKLESVYEVIALMSSDARKQVCNIEYGFETINGNRAIVDVGAVHDNRVRNPIFTFSAGTREAAEPERALEYIKDSLYDRWDDYIADVLADLIQAEEEYEFADIMMELECSDICFDHIDWNKF